MKRGVNIIGDTVGQTLGAKGQNVIIDKGIFHPFVTNDGVTIAKEIELEDRFEQMGARLTIEAAANTNDVAGDGTTTSVVLTQAIVNEGLKNIAAGANPMIITKGIKDATLQTIEQLRSMKTEVKDADIENVATISSGDPEVGKVIADVMKKVGTDGVVTVQEGQKIGLVTEVTDGLQFDNGLISPYFLTDIPRLECVHDDPFILITDKKVTNSGQLASMIDGIMKTGQVEMRELFVIAEEIDNEPITFMVRNTTEGKFKFAGVRAPGYGERRKDYLQDIAILTGGTIVSDMFGIKLEETTLSYLGRADRIIANKDSFTIVGGKGDKKAIKERLDQIKNQIEKETVEYDKDKLKERFAKLSGGIGVIKVGAPTEVEMKERKYRIEDALNATRAATDKEDGGILPGGGSALAKVLLNIPVNGDADYKTGFDIIQKACMAPLWRIADNGGYKGDVIVKEVSELKEGFGFNVLKGEYVDLLKEGIIDPLKVTITALTNASSVAVMILTTRSIIIEKPDK